MWLEGEEGEDVDFCWSVFQHQDSFLRDYDPNQTIISSGKQIQHLFVLISGLVRVEWGLAGGKKFVEEISDQSDWPVFGDVCLLNDSKERETEFSVVAQLKCCVRQIPIHVLVDAFFEETKDNNFGLKYFQNVCKNLAIRVVTRKKDLKGDNISTEARRNFLVASASALTKQSTNNFGCVSIVGEIVLCSWLVSFKKLFTKYPGFVAITGSHFAFIRPRDDEEVCDEALGFKDGDIVRLEEIEYVCLEGKKGIKIHTKTKRFHFSMSGNNAKLLVESLESSISSFSLKQKKKEKWDRLCAEYREGGDREELMKLASINSFSKGKEIFQKNQEVDFVYLLTEGSCVVDNEILSSPFIGVTEFFSKTPIFSPIISGQRGCSILSFSFSDIPSKELLFQICRQIIFLQYKELKELFVKQVFSTIHSAPSPRTRRIPLSSLSRSESDPNSVFPKDGLLCSRDMSSIVSYVVGLYPFRQQEIQNFLATFQQFDIPKEELFEELLKTTKQQPPVSSRTLQGVCFVIEEWMKMYQRFYRKHEIAFCCIKIPVKRTVTKGLTTSDAPKLKNLVHSLNFGDSVDFPEAQELTGSLSNYYSDFTVDEKEDYFTSLQTKNMKLGEQEEEEVDDEEEKEDLNPTSQSPETSISLLNSGVKKLKEELEKERMERMRVERENIKLKEEIKTLKMLIKDQPPQTRRSPGGFWSKLKSPNTIPNDLSLQMTSSFSLSSLTNFSNRPSHSPPSTFSSSSSSNGAEDLSFFRGEQYSFLESPPKWAKKLRPRLFSGRSVVVVAETITVTMSKIFGSIVPSEFHDGNWQGEQRKLNAPNLEKLGLLFNQLSFLCIVEILYSETEREQFQALMNCFELASVLKLMQNFQGMAAVVSMFSSASITRLKGLWENLQKKEPHVAKLREEFSQLFDPAENSHSYFEEEKKCRGKPVVPFLAPKLREFRYLYDRNLKGEEEYFDLSFMQKVGEKINEFLEFQNLTFLLPDPDPYVVFLLNDYVIASEEEIEDVLYQKSQAIKQLTPSLVAHCLDDSSSSLFSFSLSSRKRPGSQIIADHKICDSPTPEDLMKRSGSKTPPSNLEAKKEKKEKKEILLIQLGTMMQVEEFGTVLVSFFEKKRIFRYLIHTIPMLSLDQKKLFEYFVTPFLSKKSLESHFEKLHPHRAILKKWMVSNVTFYHITNPALLYEFIEVLKKCIDQKFRSLMAHCATLLEYSSSIYHSVEPIPPFTDMMGTEIEGIFWPWLFATNHTEHELSSAISFLMFRIFKCVSPSEFLQEDEIPDPSKAPFLHLLHCFTERLKISAFVEILFREKREERIESLLKYVELTGCLYQSQNYEAAETLSKVTQLVLEVPSLGKAFRRHMQKEGGNSVNAPKIKIPCYEPGKLKCFALFNSASESTLDWSILVKIGEEMDHYFKWQRAKYEFTPPSETLMNIFDHRRPVFRNFLVFEKRIQELVFEEGGELKDGKIPPLNLNSMELILLPPSRIGE